jgi:dynein heavy chain
MQDATKQSFAVGVFTVLVYGSHMTDEWDRRLMNCIADKYFCKDLAESKEAFMLSTSADYSRPDCESQEEFLDYARSLPSVATPDVFGLHDNALSNCNRQKAMSFLADLQRAQGSSQPRAAIDDSARNAKLLGQVRQLRERTPEVLDLAGVLKKYPQSYLQTMNIVLQQEVSRYNVLVQLMRETLLDLEGSLRGLVLMTDEVDDLGADILDGIVPKAWARVSYLSLRPLGSWIADLNERLEFLNDWSENKAPSVFWMSVFFFPQGFLSCVLQGHARLNSMPIDRLMMRSQVLARRDPKDPHTEEPKQGCYTYGFFLEGCSFDDEARVLVPSRPRQLFYNMPMIWFQPGSETEHAATSEIVYQAPVYKTQSRRGSSNTIGLETNFVTTVSLRSLDATEVWILAGVALILSLSS